MAKSNDPSNPEELVKYIASCLVENVDKIDDSPKVKRKHKEIKLIPLINKGVFEIKDRDIKTIRWINKQITIKNKIFAKQTIDRSIGADISINSPSKDISCLEILWFATNEDINDV